jgi:ubiquinone/menaquinone biosynthesis C-methylase UbiE
MKYWFETHVMLRFTEKHTDETSYKFCPCKINLAIVDFYRPYLEDLDSKVSEAEWTAIETTNGDGFVLKIPYNEFDSLMIKHKLVTASN